MKKKKRMKQNVMPEKGEADKIQKAEGENPVAAEAEAQKDEKSVKEESAEAETKEAESKEIEIKEAVPEEAAVKEIGSVEKEADKSGEATKEEEPEKAQMPESEEEDLAQTSSSKRLKWVLLAAVGLVVLLTGIYGGIAFFYQSHFLPNTIINGVDCSGLEASAAAALLDAQIVNYSLEVKGRDYATGAAGASLGVIAAPDIQLAFIGNLEAVSQILKEQNSWLWITALAPHEYSHMLVQGVNYDDALLDSVVRSWEALQSKNMIQAQNAYISEYSEELQGYEVIPETMGTELDVNQVIQTVSEAVITHMTDVDLDTAKLYKIPEVLRDDSRVTEPVETANRWLRTDITYDWNGSLVQLNIDTIKDWVSIQDGQAVLDEDAVASFVKDQARQYDTYARYKGFMTALGVEMTLYSPNYGWRTDAESETAELIALIKEGTNGEREPVYLNTANQKGTDDIGDSYVEADLTNQHLYVFEDGEIVLETDFVSGNMSAAPGNQTPQGIFGLSYKTRNAVLRGEGYATPVNYWMPFYGNYGMHDATWRGAFGGSIYLTSGSHGCINLPLSAASQIYEYVYTGSPVICYYYPEPVNPEPETPAEGEVPAEPVAE